VQAAVLRVKLARLDEWNARRSVQAARYDAALAGTSLTLPHVPAWGALDVAPVRGAHAGARRAAAALRARGWETLDPLSDPAAPPGAYAELGFAADAFPIASGHPRGGAWPPDRPAT
jgi:dTDP-4-amino-4,6-dideoxygalactose transaminase